VGVVVRDISKAIAHLEALGFGPFMFDEEHKTFAIHFKGELHGEPAEWVTTISNGQMGDVQLELLEPTEGAQALKETLDAQGEGLHHIGWLSSMSGVRWSGPKPEAPRCGPARFQKESPASVTSRAPVWATLQSNSGSREP